MQTVICGVAIQPTTPTRVNNDSVLSAEEIEEKKKRRLTEMRKAEEDRIRALREKELSAKRF